MLGVLALAVLAVQAFAPALAQAYSMTLQTNQSSYTGTQPITISGTISPAPGANTGVVIAIKNPAGAIADVTEVAPDASSGAFSYVSVPGGNSAWVSGTFSVNATWAGDGATASQVATFSYTAASTTSTSTTSVTSSTTSTTSTTTTTSSTTTTATTTSTTSTQSTTSTTSTTTSSTTIATTTPVPEFPGTSLLIAGLAAMLAVAVLGRLAVASRPRVSR